MGIASCVRAHSGSRIGVCQRPSTSIRQTSFMPLVEQTRARTQELFQQLLDRHGVGSRIEVKAFYPSAGGSELRFVDESLAWEPGMELGLATGLTASGTPPLGLVVSLSRMRIGSLKKISFIRSTQNQNILDCGASFEEFEDLLPPEQLAKVLRQDHYWYEYRNMGGPAVASTGYGLVAAALAEATNGVIASFDSAFDIEHNGESAQKFLTWWGEKQMTFYGTESFKRSRVAF